MSLYETGESNGNISLLELFDETTETDGIKSTLKLQEIFFAACRGGWPRCLALKSDKARLEIATDYYTQIYQKDISAIDGVKRNPEWARTILWYYARNMATLVKNRHSRRKKAYLHRPLHRTGGIGIITRLF